MVRLNSKNSPEQTNRNLSENSIAVVGGGLIGLSVAWRLAQAGHHVAVFDKGKFGQEASWAGAGMLAPGGEFDEPSSLAELAVESLSLYRGFVRELEQVSGVTIDYQESGALDLAYDETSWDTLQAKAASQANLNIRSKVLDRNQISTFWPRVRAEDLVGGLFYSGDALVNPRDLVSALTIACRAAGVVFQEEKPVSNIEIEPYRVRFEAGGAATTADAIVIAAGAWSSQIELQQVKPLPLAEPIRGHLVGFQQPEQVCNTILRHGHTYLLQRSNGLLIAGASVERVGWDRTIQSDVAMDLARQASFILPHLAETSPTDVWIGFRPGGDSLQLGPWHSPRLMLAYGHYRNGILLAPITAQRVTNELSANLQKL
jgi:glycine oxidase